MSGNVIFNTAEILKLDQRAIQDLKRMALAHPDRQFRICMHQDLADPVHEMVIVHCRGAYIRPHKHINKTESFHMIEGGLLVVIFDDDGSLIDRIEMGLGQEGRYRMCRMEKGIWHMVIPTSDIAVFHEVTRGPFSGRGDNTFPDWAPGADETSRIESFMSRILR